MERDQRIEIEANLFALEILIPREMLKAEIMKLKIGKNMIPILAKRFQVSESTMTTRLLNLGLLTCV